MITEPNVSRHPDRAVVRCQGLARQATTREAKHVVVVLEPTRASAISGLWRDQEAHPRCQASKDVASHGPLEHPPRHAHRTGAVGADPVAVNPPVRSRGVAAHATVHLGRVPPARLHWTSVVRLIERWVEESAERQFWRPLRVIGVDEVNHGRDHHKYLIIVWTTSSCL